MADDWVTLPNGKVDDWRTLPGHADPRPKGFFEGMMSLADEELEKLREHARKLGEHVQKGEYGQILGDVADAISPPNHNDEIRQRSVHAAQNASQGKPLVDPQQNLREANDQLLGALSVPPGKFREAQTRGDYPYMAGQGVTSALLNSWMLEGLGGGRKAPPGRGLPKYGTGIDDLELLDQKALGTGTGSRALPPAQRDLPPAPQSPVEELRAQSTGLSKIAQIPELVEGGAPPLTHAPTPPVSDIARPLAGGVGQAAAGPPKIRTETDIQGNTRVWINDQEYTGNFGPGGPSDYDIIKLHSQVRNPDPWRRLEELKAKQAGTQLESITGVPPRGRGIEESPFGQTETRIAPNEQTGQVAQFQPYKDELQALANETGGTVNGRVNPEEHIPVVHDPQYGGFQHHRRGNGNWVTHPMFPDQPIGPFANDEAAFDWTLEVQDTPTFRSQLDPDAPAYLPPSNRPDTQLQRLLQGVSEYKGLPEDAFYSPEEATEKWNEALAPPAEQGPFGGTPPALGSTGNVAQFTPPGRPRQIYHIAEDIRNSLKDPNSTNIDALLDEGEQLIQNETDPEIIRDNFDQMDQYLDGARIHGSDDEIEVLGILRDTALDKSRQAIPQAPPVQNLPPPSGDISGIRQQQVLGEPKPFDIYKDAIGEADPAIDQPIPLPQGQMELPWSKGVVDQPIDADAEGRARQTAADRFTRAQGEEPQQLSLEDQITDAEIKAYLEGEDAEPPESIDLSDYEPRFERIKKPGDEEFQQIWDNLVKMLGREPTDKEFMAVVRKGNKSTFSPTSPKGNLFEGSEGKGLGKEGYEQQWTTAIKEAEAVGLNWKEYDNLDSLQWDTTRKVAQIVAEGGENPLAKLREFDLNTDIAKEIDEKGNLKGSMAITAGIENLTRDYKGELPGIMVREGMQNALDAVKDQPDGTVRIRITPESSRNGTPAMLEIHDNGSGMDLQTLGDKLFEVFGTGKVGDPTATGGKGIGSASYIFGGDRFEIESTAIDAKDGKKYTITAGGTPAEILAGVPPNKVKVPMSTPTGTKMKVTMKDAHESIDARVMLDKITDFTRNRNTKIIYDREGDSNAKGTPIEKLNPAIYEAIETTPKVTKDDKTVAIFTHKNSEVTVQIPPYNENLENDEMRVHHLNNGMYQFTKDIYVDKAKGIPRDVIVNIEPKINEKHIDYPFINTREDVKDDLRNLIQETVQTKVSGPAVTRRKNRVQELYDQMPEIQVPGTIRKTMLFDPGMRFTPDETNFLVNHPVVHELARHFDSITDNILKKVGRPNWGSRLEGVGLVFDDSLNGVHIPNPATGKSTILFSIFPRIGMHTPEDAAYKATTTVKHEIAHIGTEAGTGLMPNFTPADESDPRYPKWIKTFFDQSHTHGDVGYQQTGHKLDFFHRLGEVYAKTGVGETYNAAKKLEWIYTGGSGTSYSPEIQELLQLHQDRAGRPETTEDLLSGTGVKQANRGPIRAGTVSSNDQANGVGVLDKRVSRELDKIFDRLTGRGEMRTR